VTVLPDIPSTVAAWRAESTHNAFQRWSPPARARAAMSEGGTFMLRKILFAACIGVGCAAFGAADTAQAQQAYGQNWGGTYTTQDWNRFYHYPYVYYPQNYWGSEYYRSADSLYYRYPPEMRIPVYNRKWHNYYPNRRKFHSGHHFVLDVF
jgi:hypothetical protein